jgi:hypothetical protein
MAARGAGATGCSNAARPIRCDLEQNQQQYVQTKLHNNDYVPIPVGRASWHSQNREKLLAKIRGEPMKTALTGADLHAASLRLSTYSSQTSSEWSRACLGEGPRYGALRHLASLSSN